MTREERIEAAAQTLYEAGWMHNVGGPDWDSLGDPHKAKCREIAERAMAEVLAIWHQLIHESLHE